MSVRVAEADAGAGVAADDVIVDVAAAGEFAVFPGAGAVFSFGGEL